MADAHTCPRSIIKATQQHTEPVQYNCRWGAYCRLLANMIELSMCVSDAAFCQITLTACYIVGSECA